MTDLLSAWQQWKLPKQGQDLILKEDELAFENLNRHAEPVRYDSWKDCWKGHDPFATSTRLHPRLIPLPYMGNLSTARVVLLLLNPGLSASDYFAEYENMEFRARKLANLRQDFEGEEYPFFSLDPSLAWHSGTMYWEKKLSAVIKEVAVRLGWDNNNARRLVANRIAALELLPYHSLSFGLPAAAKKEMHSMRLAKQYASDLAAKARGLKREVLLVVMRKHSEWDLGSYPGTVVGIPKGHSRGGHLSMIGDDAVGPLIVNALV
jgi:hypothetical protein